MSEAQELVGEIPFGPSALIDTVSWTEARLATFGIPIPAGNRLLRARKMLEDVQARRLILSATDDALLNRVTEAQWTIVEQYFATRALGRPGRRLSDTHRRKLEEMLSGTDTPEDDRNHLARNTQFELYIAALFTMGDLPCVLEEPDLRFEHLGRPHGVAAKRVRSFRKAAKNALKAADQVLASGLPGVVAVNVDVLLKTSATLPGPDTTLADCLAVVEKIERLMSEREHVVATMTVGRECTWDFSGTRPAVSASTSVRFTAHPRRDGDETRSREFFDRLMRRINDRLQTL
jgi:hypothetical protein